MERDVKFSNVYEYAAIILSIWISCVLEQKHTTRLVVKDFWFIFSHILQFGNATYLFWWIMSFVNYDLFCLPLKLSWEWLFCTHQKWTLIHMTVINFKSTFIRLKLRKIVWTILKNYGLSINDIISKWTIFDPRP